MDFVLLLLPSFVEVVRPLTGCLGLLFGGLDDQCQRVGKRA